MAQTFALKAESRQKLGKGDARSLRRGGRIPAVIYGGKEKPLHVSLPAKELSMQTRTRTFRSTVFELEVDGNVVKALPREVQLNPVTDIPEHVDFERLAEGRMRIWVPVEFINREKSSGLKRGGILNIVRRQIEFLCEATNIPAKITVDLDGRDIGESIHISSVEVPEGVQPVIERDFTICTIVGKGKTTSVEEESAAEGEEAEGEGEAAEGAE